MIALDGMPGAGKTTALRCLHQALPQQVIIHPEAHPTDESRPDAEIARELLAEAQRRRDAAQRLRHDRPELLFASDRCHIGVLAYRHASMATGQGTQQDFEHALELAAAFGLTTPGASERILVLLIDPTESTARRSAHAHDARYRRWFDRDFLTAYHHFLTNLADWLPEDSFTLHDAAATSTWSILTAALPHHIRAQIPSGAAQPSA
ncbi:hypothetical protein ACPA54_37120 [Uniformispora flossi]|uniref:hypothetical protein n=1 Tax=Uniformispora flossi TaxID=3390723 RepID=UPI003C309F46